MTILHPSPVSTKFFTWIAERREFVAEASSLPVRFGRVYDDACDEGLTLVSQRTGREVVFVVERTEIDEEGDLQFWELRPAFNGHFDVCDIKVRIFND